MDASPARQRIIAALLRMPPGEACSAARVKVTAGSPPTIEVYRVLRELTDAGSLIRTVELHAPVRWRMAPGARSTLLAQLRQLGAERTNR